jgi:hypothetical protein
VGEIERRGHLRVDEPGATQSTVTPRDPRSQANDRVKPSSPGSLAARRQAPEARAGHDCGDIGRQDPPIEGVPARDQDCVRDVAALTADLNAWVAAWNDNPRPFV